MKLTIRKKAAVSLKDKIKDLSNEYYKTTEKIPRDLLEILLNDKNWAQMNALFITSSIENKTKVLIMLNEYEKEKAKTSPHFRELINFKTQFSERVSQEMPELVPLINGESKYKFIRELDRLILFGPPSTQKNKFFGLLFVLLAVGGIFGTTVGVLANQGLKDWFATAGPFGIKFIKDLANGYDRILNIGSWYVAFEILGFKGMNLIRKDDVFQIPKDLKSKKEAFVKNNTYMIDQNLNNMMSNIKQIMEYSKNPEFGPLMMDNHPWAVDHLTVATENIDQVTEFLNAQFNKK